MTPNSTLYSVHKKGNRTHILVIRLSAMGDVAMTLPVLTTLTATYPTLQLTVLTKKHFLPFFSGLERITAVEADIKSRHKGPRGLWRLYKTLKAQQFTAVADLHGVLRSHTLKIFFALDRIPFVQINKGRKEKKALTRARNKKFQQLKTTHQRYADVFAQLGFPIELSQAQPLAKQPLSQKSKAWLGKETKKRIGIAPFASKAGKRYPLPLMQKVIETLNSTQNYTVLLFGGGSHEAKQLETLSKDFHTVLNVAGKINLSEELALISNLDVMLAMDSSNAHMAANYGIPVVILWGVTHPFAGFYPFGQPLSNALLANRQQYPLIPTCIYGNKVPKGYQAVMETIPPKKVVEKLLTIVER